MSILATRARAHMRRIVSKFLIDTCTITAQPQGLDELGALSVGLDSVWATVATGVACRVIGEGQGGSASALVASQEQMADTLRIVCPAGTALAPDQRITVTSTGHVYTVVGLETDLTDALYTLARVVRLR